MKKTVVLLFVFVMLFTSSLIFGASGKALIPFFYAYKYSATQQHYYYLYVSNVSDQTVTVTITLYHEDGTVVTDDGSMTAGDIIGHHVSTNYDDSLTGSTVSFDLASDNSGYICVCSDALATGYGRIEWSYSGSTNRPREALVAYGRRYYQSTATGANYASDAFVPINNGKPF